MKYRTCDERIIDLLKQHYSIKCTIPIILTTHINNVFQTIENAVKHTFFQAFVATLNGVPTTQKHHVKHHAFSLTMQCFGNVFEKPLKSMFLTIFFKARNIVQMMLIAHPLCH